MNAAITHAAIVILVIIVFAAAFLGHGSDWRSG